jgi:hypothetical protein
VCIRNVLAIRAISFEWNGWPVYIRNKTILYRRKSLIWFWISLAVILPAVPMLVESIIQGITNPRGLTHVILLYLASLLHVGFLVTAGVSTWFGIRAYMTEKVLCYWVFILYVLLIFMLFQYEILTL